MRAIGIGHRHSIWSVASVMPLQAPPPALLSVPVLPQTATLTGAEDIVLTQLARASAVSRPALARRQRRRAGLPLQHLARAVLRGQGDGMLCGEHQE